MPAKDAVGRYGERVAERFLVDSGLVILERNWRCSLGEIDIVARDGDCLVVCEVKTRSSTAYGHSLEAVSWRKAARLRRLAMAWVDARGVRPPAGAHRPGRRHALTPGRGRGQPPPGGRLMLGRTTAVALTGLEGEVVEVEADAASGLPAFTITGLPDAALGEARDRVRAAIGNSGLPFTLRRLTVNLSPASLPKGGSSFDLAIAVAVLSASELVPPGRVQRVVHLAELGLDGRLRPVPGVLPAVLAAVRRGRPRVVVAKANETEARLVAGAEVLAVGSLAELVGLYRGEPVPEELLVDLRDLDEDAAPGDGSRRRSGSGARTWPTWPGRRRPGARSRWPRPEDTTCCSSGRPARARRCWPPGCPGCCPTWTTRWPWRSPRSTRWPAGCRAEG